MAANKIEIAITPKLVIAISLPIIVIAMLIGLFTQLNYRRSYQKFLNMKAQVEHAPELENIRQVMTIFNPEDEPQINQLAETLDRINVRSDLIDTLQLIIVQGDSYRLIEKDCCYTNETNSCEPCNLKTAQYLNEPKDSVLKNMREGKMLSEQEMFKRFYEDRDRQTVGIVTPLKQTSLPVFLYATYSWYP